MTGKGWTWVGDGRWVRPLTRLQAQLDAAAGNKGHATLVDAITGVLGVAPAVSSPSISLARLSLESWLPAAALRASPAAAAAGFFSGPGVTPLPDAALPFPPPPSGAAAATACPALVPWNSTAAVADGVGLPPDLWAIAVFDAVWAAAGAVADALTVQAQAQSGHSSSAPLALSLPPLANLSLAAVAETLRRGMVSRPSPVLGAPLFFLPNGDRAGVALALVNVLPSGALATAGTWISTASAAPPAPGAQLNASAPWPAGVAYTAAGSTIAGDGDAAAGAWQGAFSSLTWAGGSLEVPPDRALESDYATAAALAWILGGVVASLLIGAILHDA